MFALMGYEWVSWIFVARVVAIIIVSELNKIFPYQRVAGLCHITNVWSFICMDDDVIKNGGDERRSCLYH